MKVDLAKFLALTTMMAAPIVTACDLEEEDETTSSTAAGTSATAGGDDGGTAADDGGTAGGTAGGSGDGADAGATTTADGSGGEQEVGDCCAAHPEVGCSVPTIQECVCAVDSLCCDEGGSWDEVCVSLVDSEGCGICPAGPEVGEGDCCEVNKTAGCNDAEIQACVCDQDPLCCGDEDGVWDQICVDEVDMFKCGVCAE